MWENTRGDARGAEPAVAGRRPDRLRLLDLRTGRVTTPASRSRRHVVEAVQRPGGGPIALLTWPVPEPYPGLLGAELHVWDPVSGTTLDLGPAGVEASSLAWWKADDGWHLAYLAVTPPAVLDVSVPAAPRQAVRRRNLTAGADVCPTDLVQVADGAPLVVFADGLDTAISEGVADPDRLGIAGWSHGGFLAAWAVSRTDRFRAGLMGAGISDWGMLVSTGGYGTLEAALCGGTDWEGVGPHRHDRLSPISFASAVRTPVLVVHGEDDTNVPVSQAEAFHRALCDFGVEHGYVVYPREGHAIRERNHQRDLLRRTREWFDRWLMPDRDPAIPPDRREG